MIPAPCFSDNFLEDRTVKNETFFYPLCHMQRSLLRSEVIDFTTLKNSLLNEVNLANWATFDALMVWLLFGLANLATFLSISPNLLIWLHFVG